jgi:hypothetical protein
MILYVCFSNVDVQYVPTMNILLATMLCVIANGNTNETMSIHMYCIVLAFTTRQIEAHCIVSS